MAATFYFAELDVAEQARNPQHPFWGPFYESWTAGFAFWAIVGIIGTMIVLTRPEDEIYSERIRILFGGVRRPALKYLEGQIRSMGYFAIKVSADYTVEEWNAAIEAYKVKVVLKTTIQNLLHDERASDEVGTTIVPDPLPAQMSNAGEILEFRINGGPNQLTCPIPIIAPKLEYPHPVSIEPGKAIEVEIKRWAWFKASEMHSYTPRRFAEQVIPSITYSVNVGQRKADVILSWRDGSNDPAPSPGTKNCVQRELVWGKEEVFPVVGNVEPGKQAFAFRLSPPK